MYNQVHAIIYHRSTRLFFRHDGKSCNDIQLDFWKTANSVSTNAVFHKLGIYDLDLVFVFFLCLYLDITSLLYRLNKSELCERVKVWTSDLRRLKTSEEYLRQGDPPMEQGE